MKNMTLIKKDTWMDTKRGKKNEISAVDTNMFVRQTTMYHPRHDVPAAMRPQHRLLLRAQV